MPEGGSKIVAFLGAQKERLLFALALALLAWSGYVAFGPRPGAEALPEEARVAPVSVTAPGAGGRIYAGELGQYWKESARYVFGRKATVRVFVPADLTLPLLAPDPAPGPLPSPGPRLEYTKGLPRWTE